MPILIQKISASQFPFTEPNVNGVLIIKASLGSEPYFKVAGLEGYLIDLSQAKTTEDFQNPINFGYKTNTPYIEYRF